MRLKLLLVLTLGLFYIQTASASGISVTPEKIFLENFNNTSTTQTLTVANPSADVQIFEVYPDDFSDIIKIYPSSFTMEAGARKTVEISTTNKTQIETGSVITTNLSIVSKPILENKFSVGTGVKIPVTVTFSQNTKVESNKKFNSGYLNIGLVILLFALMVLVAKKYTVTNKHKL
jgi:UDP-3-O-[3-hydroxymyristoyl] glucosamine N-acyltransferase